MSTNKLGKKLKIGVWGLITVATSLQVGSSGPRHETGNVCYKPYYFFGVPTAEGKGNVSYLCQQQRERVTLATIP